MFQAIVNWIAANREFTGAAMIAIVGIVVCSLVFPQDGSGGDLDFFGGTAVMAAATSLVEERRRA